MGPIARGVMLALAAATAMAARADAQAPAQTPAPAPAAKTFPAPNPPMFAGAEYAMGNPKAKVTLVEYASASCPHCARFDISSFPELKAKYIDTGKVRYVFREFLTPPEQVAAIGFLLARCAGEANYFKVVDQFFHDQEQIYQTGDLKGVVLKIAGSVGLSEAQVNACLNDKAALDALNARVDAAVNKAHVDSTPTFFINGKKFVGDPHKEMDFAELDEALAPLVGGSHAPRERRTG